MIGDYKIMLAYVKWRANPEGDMDEVKPEDAQAFLDVMADRFNNASETFQHWGDYASGYFQNKWGLDQDVSDAKKWADEMAGRESYAD